MNVDSANTTAIEYDSYGDSPWTLTQTANNGAIFGQTLTRVQGAGGAIFRFHGTCTPSFYPAALVYSAVRCGSENGLGDVLLSYYIRVQAQAYRCMVRSRCRRSPVRQSCPCMRWTEGI